MCFVYLAYQRVMKNEIGFVKWVPYIRGRVIERDGVCVCLSEGVNENVGGREREKENTYKIIN